MNKQQEITRRGFLSGMGMVSAGVAAAALTTAPTQAFADEAASASVPGLWTPEVPESWDAEADIVVLGSGIAGACGAIEAYELGMDVLMVTAAPSVVQCACTLSGGAISGCNTAIQADAGEEDDVEDMIKDVLRCGGEMGDPDVIRAWCENSGETIDWMEELGCTFTPTVHDGNCFTHKTAHSSSPAGTGRGVMEGLAAAVDERGINVMWNTPAKKLYRAENGDVVGCYVEDENGQGSNIKARKGILLATGGFGINEELWRLYNPYTAWVIANSRKVVLTGPAEDKGEGILMATAIGADAYRSPANYGTGGVEVGPESGMGNGNLLPYSWAADGMIEVTTEGKRFNDETSFPDFFGDTKKFTGIPEMWNLSIFDENARLSDGGQRQAQAIIDLAQENGMDSVFCADTIEELCEHFNVPADAVKQSIEEFNGFVDDGGPDEFGRTEFNAKIETPPFWGIEQSIAIGLSKGGLKTSPRAEVLDVFDQPIPRLYAAGEVAFARTMGDGRIHITGAQNGSAATFGRIGARSINELDPQE